MTTHQSTPKLLEHPAIPVLHMDEHHRLAAGMQIDAGEIARAAERAMKKAGASDAVLAGFAEYLEKVRASRPYGSESSFNDFVAGVTLARPLSHIRKIIPVAFLDGVGRAG